MIKTEIGEIDYGEKLPENCLWCHGQNASAPDYPELFALIKYQYGGEGDSFKVPDYRPRQAYIKAR